VNHLRPRFLDSASSGLARRVGGPATNTPTEPAAATTFLRPRWLGLHAFVIALTITMVFLGRWQLTVSNEKHFDLQNFGYALQWWAFSACAVFFWILVIRDARRPPVAPGGGARLAVRTDQPSQVVDDTYIGPASLIRLPDRADQAPMVYRGYVIPNSSAAPARSNDDSYHGAYNDYLWQLGLADTAGRQRRGGSNTGPVRSVDAATLDAATLDAVSSADSSADPAVGETEGSGLD
jgi:hypothetical protein